MPNTPGIDAAESNLAKTWIGSVDLRSIAESVGTPVFIYSAEQLIRNVGRIREAAIAVGLGDRVRLYVPFFPNSNPHVLQPLRDMGVGLLLQLPSEYKVLSRFGFNDFIVSPGHVSNEEIGFWSRLPYPVFLSSLDEVAFALQAGAPSISARIDSLDSGKPGIKYGELASLAKLLGKYDRNLESFEVYCGSGNSRDEMIAVIERLFAIFNEYFPHVRSVDFAGGHGFVYEEWDEAGKHFDWGGYFEALRGIMDRMSIPERVKLMFEPARDVLADVGVLMLGVKRDLLTNPVYSLVVTDGSRMLMPSAQLRDRRHNVAFLDSSMSEITLEGQDDQVYAAVRGRSILRNDYILPGEYRVPASVAANSYMLIFDTGVYCATQHMEFLNIPPAAEVLVDQRGTAHLITRRGDELDKWRYLLHEKQELPQESHQAISWSARESGGAIADLLDER